MGCSNDSIQETDTQEKGKIQLFDNQENMNNGCQQPITRSERAVRILGLCSCMRFHRLV